MRHWPIAIAVAVVPSTVMATLVSCNWFKYDYIIRRTDADDRETNPLNINIYRRDGGGEASDERDCKNRHWCNQEEMLPLQMNRLIPQQASRS